MATDTTAHPSSDTASAAPSAEAATPAVILSQLYAANSAEIQLSQLAEKNASSLSVKRIAAKLASDHVKSREAERALAQKLDVSLPVLPSDTSSVSSDLQGKTGRDFDQAFVEHEIKGHDDNIHKLQTQLLPAASNPEVKAYLHNALTMMQGHLASLKQVRQQLRS